MPATGSRRRLQVAVVAALFIAGTGCTGLEGLGPGSIPSIPPGGTDFVLDEPTVANGLRQALDVGIRQTTTGLSQPGAFANDARLRIPLPNDLAPFASALRGVGLGGQVDALELAMNEAAEKAAGEAFPIFASAIASMTIADAFSILNGERDAATRYFEDRTSGPLAERFAPIAKGAMEQVGLYPIYQSLRGHYDRLPIAKAPSVDLEAYVAERTLTALFSGLAAEEERIRANPAARTTELLRRVFGSMRQPG